MREPIIAIDGPSGAGKSTLSKLLAEQLGFTHIDTGAMYRCVALASHRISANPEDEHALSQLCRNIEIRFERMDDGQTVWLDDENVTSAIRQPEISLLTSRVAAVPAVRDAMVAMQRQMGETGGVVLEGRDIGSVVFPNAEVKFFLNASAEERGRRRYEELLQAGQQVDLAQTIAEVEARDLADQQREHSPLVQADDAIPVDSTSMSIDQVLSLMLDHVNRFRSEGARA